MEVHSHTHTTRKKWSHYFWEFFMLFLAVTLGFLVENEREHMLEHKRERQYVHSYTEDLHADIKQLDSLISYSGRRNLMMDSLTYLLGIPEPVKKDKQLIYYYARCLTINAAFFNYDRTIQQLKNGGNLRLIRKQDVSDGMMNYDVRVHWLENIRSREEEYIREYVQKLEELFDTRVFSQMTTPNFKFVMPEGEPQMLVSDKKSLQQFTGLIYFMKSANTLLMINYSRLLNTARETLDIIKMEYHLG